MTRAVEGSEARWTRLAAEAKVISDGMRAKDPAGYAAAAAVVAKNMRRQGLLGAAPIARRIK